LIPGIQFHTEKAWAGTFGDTKDGLPFIGTKRGAPHLIYALCYGANGTNFAMIASNLIQDRLQGRRNRDQALFSLYR
jgi:glycine/D-amino acid oxidase-like deaminating enzyme